MNMEEKCTLRIHARRARDAGVLEDADVAVSIPYKYILSDDRACSTVCEQKRAIQTQMTCIRARGGVSCLWL